MLMFLYGMINYPLYVIFYVMQFITAYNYQKFNHQIDKICKYILKINKMFSSNGSQKFTVPKNPPSTTT